MLDRKTYVLDGVMVAEQPLAVSPPSSSARTKQGEPKQVPRMIVYRAGERVEVPYFPAASIRGKLRRRARDVARDAVIARTGNPTPWDLDTHFFVTIGGVKGREGEDKRSVQREAQWRERNPHLSLFGAGQPFVWGALHVSNAIPTGDAEVVEIGSGVRSDDLKRDRSQVRFLSPADVEEYVRRSQGNKDRSATKTELKRLRVSARKLAGDERAGAEDRIAQLDGELKRHEESTGAVSMQMPLDGFEAIAQGTRLAQKMRLMRVTPVELGLFIKGLQRFALEPIVGAHASVGCGEVSFEFSVTEVTDSGSVALGHLGVKPYEGLVFDGPVAELARAAEDAWAKASEGDGLDFTSILAGGGTNGDE